VLQAARNAAKASTCAGRFRLARHRPPRRRDPASWQIFDIDRVQDRYQYAYATIRPDIAGKPPAMESFVVADPVRVLAIED
jgi:hypothetical protein